MIDNLLGLVQQVAGSAISSNPDVPNEKNNAVIESVADGLLSGFKNQASSANGIGQILSLFGGSGDSSSVKNSITQSIQTSVVSSLMDKVGIKNELAKSIAGQVVPLIIGALSNPKKNDINVSSLLGSITGGSAGGVDVQSLLNKFAGGDDGKFDLNDVAGILGKLGKKDDNSSDNSGGGILGALGGLFGGKK